MGVRVRDIGKRARRMPGAAVRGVRRRPIRAAVVVGLLVLTVPMAALGWVRWSARDHVYAADAVPPAPVAIVLGAGLRPDGSPTSFLEARLAVAAGLYRDGKVEALLVSGDHGTVEHDEVGAMTTWLVDRGVPPTKVVADHAGFDTYDSCQRAHRIFGVDDAIVVTQDFHVPRAVFLCRQAGIDAVGVAAPAPGGGNRASTLREVPASLKAVVDAVVDPGPRYLGRYETGVDDAVAG